MTDHIIIGNGDSYYSFQEAGIMSFEKLRETKGDFLKEAEAAYRTDILSLRPMTEEERRLIQISFSCLQNRLKE